MEDSAIGSACRARASAPAPTIAAGWLRARLARRRRAAARLARAARQRPHVPRNLAARRPARCSSPRSASRGRRRSTAAAAAADVRRRGRARARRGAARDRSRPRAGLRRRAAARRAGSPSGSRAYGFRTERGRVRRRRSRGSATSALRNVIATRDRASPRTRSSSWRTATTRASGRGANDNASGTAVLIELARGYARASTDSAAGDAVRPAHTIVLPLDRRRRVRRPRRRALRRRPGRTANRIVAVVNLDAVAGRGRAAHRDRGDRPARRRPALVQTAAERILEQTGRGAGATRRAAAARSTSASRSASTGRRRSSRAASRRSR